LKVLVEGGHARTHPDVCGRAHALGRRSLPGGGGRAAPALKSRRCAAALLSAFDQYVKLNKKTAGIRLVSPAIDEGDAWPIRWAAHLPLKLEEKQQVLEMFDVKARAGASPVSS